MGLASSGPTFVVNLLVVSRCPDVVHAIMVVKPNNDYLVIKQAKKTFLSRIVWVSHCRCPSSASAFVVVEHGDVLS